ncbi:MAG TPA: DUF3788 family protein [Bacteroidales bacterium]
MLNDKSVKPNDDIIFSIIGDTELLWKQTFSYLFDNSKDISVNWKYSDCGKYWVCIVLKKNDTIFRLRIFKMNSFHLVFPFGDKLEPIILQSKLPDSIKNDFVNAKRYNSTRYISIEVQDSGDFENIKKLIDIKIKS